MLAGGKTALDNRRTQIRRARVSFCEAASRDRAFQLAPEVTGDMSGDSPLPADSPAYAAFISYAKPDLAKAQEICESLERRGFPCWIAPRDVPAGSAYGDEIILGIERSRCLVLVLSEAANQSPFVYREVERAVSKLKPVFPIRIQEVLPSRSLEFFVSTSQWIDAFHGVLTTHVERLAGDLSDERVMQAGSEASRRIRRRRRLPKWILAGATFVAVIAAIVAGNALSRHLHPAPEPATGPAPATVISIPGMPQLKFPDASKLTQNDVVPEIELMLDHGDSAKLSFRVPPQYAGLFGTATISYAVGDRPAIQGRGNYLFGNQLTSLVETLEVDRRLKVSFDFNLLMPGVTPQGSLGPFTYDFDYERALRDAYKRRAFGRRVSLTHDELRGWTLTHLADIYVGVRNVRFGAAADRLDTTVAMPQPPTVYFGGDSDRFASFIRDKQIVPESLRFAKSIAAQLEFFDGTTSDVVSGVRDAAAGGPQTAADAFRETYKRKLTATGSAFGFPPGFPAEGVPTYFDNCRDGVCRFHSLREYYPAVARIHVGEKPDALDRVIEIKQPPDLSSANVAEHAEKYWLKGIPYRLGTEKIYVQLEFYDGTKSRIGESRVESGYAGHFGDAQLTGKQLEGVAESGGKAPPLFATPLPSRNEMMFAPDLTPETKSIGYSFDAGGFLSVTRNEWGLTEFRGPMNAGQVRVQFTLADGTKLGPYRYQVDAGSQLAAALKKHFVSLENAGIRCRRFKQRSGGIGDPLQQRIAWESAFGTNHLDGITPKPCVICTPRALSSGYRIEEQADLRSWGAAKEVRVGTKLDRLDQTIPVTAFPAGDSGPPSFSSPTAVWHVVLPVDTTEVYVQIVFRDDTTGEIVRLPIEEIDLP
jgi:hypothetical protein